MNKGKAVSRFIVVAVAVASAGARWHAPRTTFPDENRIPVVASRDDGATAGVAIDPRSLLSVAQCIDLRTPSASEHTLDDMACVPCLVRSQAARRQTTRTAGVLRGVATLQGRHCLIRV